MKNFKLPVLVLASSMLLSSCLSSGTTYRYSRGNYNLTCDVLGQKMSRLRQDAADVRKNDKFKLRYMFVIPAVIETYAMNRNEKIVQKEMKEVQSVMISKDCSGRYSESTVDSLASGTGYKKNNSNNNVSYNYNANGYNQAAPNNNFRPSNYPNNYAPPATYNRGNNVNNYNNVYGNPQPSGNYYNNYRQQRFVQPNIQNNNNAANLNNSNYQNPANQQQQANQANPGANAYNEAQIYQPARNSANWFSGSNTDFNSKQFNSDAYFKGSAF